MKNFVIILRLLVALTPLLLILKWIGVVDCNYLVVFTPWLIVIAWFIISLIIGSIAYKLNK